LVTLPNIGLRQEWLSVLILSTHPYNALVCERYNNWHVGVGPFFKLIVAVPINVVEFIVLFITGFPIIRKSEILWLYFAVP